MSRTLLAAFLLAASGAVVFAPSCNASVTEGCLDGPCASANGGMGGATASAASTASSTTGTGGMTADSCPATPQTGDIPCNVFAIIHQRCHPCHTQPQNNGAPFPLLTYADTQMPFGPGRLIFMQMYDQTRPNACPHMPQCGALTDAELTTLTDWLDSCAPPVPSGTGCGCVTPPTPATPGSGNGCEGPEPRCPL